MLLHSQLYGRGDFAVQFQSDKWNPADFPEVPLWEVKLYLEQRSTAEG